MYLIYFTYTRKTSIIINKTRKLPRRLETTKRLFTEPHTRHLPVQRPSEFQSDRRGFRHRQIASVKETRTRRGQLILGGVRTERINSETIETRKRRSWEDTPFLGFRTNKRRRGVGGYRPVCPVTGGGGRVRVSRGWGLH